MKKHVYQQYTQLSFNFECSSVSDSEKVEQKASVLLEQKKSVQVERYHCTKEEFEAQQAIERDYMFGRAAWLYAQLEREMEHERKVAREMAQSILSSCQTIMSHMEFVTGHTSLQLAGDNEQYWKIYGLNCLVFTELAARAQGKTKRNPNPLMK